MDRARPSGSSMEMEGTRPFGQIPPLFRQETDNGTLADGPPKAGSKLDDINIQLASVLTIASIGIPYNIVCICVLSKNIKKRPTVFKIFLGFIAMATLSLFVLSLIASQRIMAWYFFEHIYSLVTRFLRPFLDRSMSVLVVLISVNRLIMVNWPLVARSFIVVRYIGRTAICMLTLIALLTIPVVFEGKITPSDHKSRATVTTEQNITELATITPFYTTTMTIIFNIILAVCLIGVNVVLTVQHAKHIMARKAIASNAKITQRR